MKPSRNAAAQVAVVYAVFATAWILMSDSLAAVLPTSLSGSVQTAKGLLFVAVTSAVLYLVAHKWADRLQDEARHSAAAERLLSQVVTTVPVGVVLLSDDLVVTFMNPAAETLLGSSMSDAVGRKLEGLGLAAGDDGAVGLGELLQRGSVDGLTVGGSSQALVARVAPVDADWPTAGWVMALSDVTDAHLSRERAQTLARGYRFLSDAAVSMSRSFTLQQILADLSRLAVDAGGYSGAWALGLPVGADAIVAHEGLGPETEDAARHVAEAYSQDAEFAARFVDDVRVSNDIAQDPMNPLFGPASAEGFGSSAQIVAAGADGTVAILTVFSCRVGEFGPDEVALLGALRSALVFAMDRIALEEKRLEAEEALSRSEGDYRQLFVRHPQPMWIYDLATLAFLAVNDAAVAKYGYSRDRFLSMTIADIRPADEVPRLLDNVIHVTEGLEDAGIWTHVDASGRSFPVHIYSHTITWEGRAAEVVMVMEVARVE